MLVHPDRVDDGPLVEDLRRMARDIGPEDFLHQQRAIMSRPDSRPGLAAISCPVLLIYGRADAITTWEHQQEMLNAIPDVRLETVGDSGHMLPLERPEKVKRAVARFSRALASQLCAHDLRAGHHRLELAERRFAREVFHSAVRRDDQPFCGHVLERGTDAVRHGFGALDLGIVEIDDAEHDRLVTQRLEDCRVQPGLRGLDRDDVDLAVLEFGEERIGLRLGRALMDVRIAETYVQCGFSRDALERTVDGLHRVGTGLIGARLQIRFVELNDIGTGGKQIVEFRVDGVGVIHRQRFVVCIVVVLRLLVMVNGPGRVILMGLSSAPS